MYDEQKIGKILLAGHYVVPADFDRVSDLAKKNHLALTDALIQEGLVTRNLLGQAIAESLKVHFADLAATPPSRETILLLPEAIAKKYQVALVKHTEKEVTIAAKDLEQVGLDTELKKIFKSQKITMAFAFAGAIADTFIHYRKALETRFADIIKGQKRIAPEIIDEIIADAVAFRASDIHLEPQDKEVMIRFRIDGVLHEAGRIAKEYYGNLLNRLKVQTHLPIDEHFSAQDGAIRYQKDNLSLDMRVSILPTLDGEKVVIRLLSHYVRNFTLGDLGLSQKDQEILASAAKKPFGMILVVGPTGSGKSTTLYALLKILNRPEVNITTIEDPVEYKMVGVNQIQVNPQTNLTFAAGLRSIARQDPDIILVGEIRDKETSEIAVNAALTGHLLFSTFHANDSATAIPRLLEMGTEPFLLASTLQLIIAQRLVRRLCDQCRHSVDTKEHEIAALLPTNARHYFSGKTTTLYESSGCSSCGGTGFRGRIAIFEFILITPEMQELVLKAPSTQEIWHLARKQASQTLFEDGVAKVKSGMTSLAELLRVAEPPKR